MPDFCGGWLGDSPLVKTWRLKIRIISVGAGLRGLRAGWNRLRLH